MLVERQRRLLTLLDALREPVGNTDFQKLLFLYTQECEASPSYEFVPYKFGAFSFTSYADKRKLTAEGMIEEDEQNWKLTAAGRETARKHAVTPLVASRFCRERAKLRGNALIAEQYRKFPYYATRSEIVDKLPLDAEAKARIKAAQPKKAGAGIVTIGYEGKSLESYLNQLLRAGVTVLCDVRRNPLSRKYGFSKKTLSHACEGVGIRYEHLPELGIDSEERRDLETQADYDALFAEYERKSLPKQTGALEKIRGWVRDGERVALTCYEAQACQCHRGCVAKALRLSGGKEMVPVHL
ncbi:MAG: DUF488 domain-containing protein [Verrucomicrobia bacterium]|nr:DUF488 domain-containing protein [Verrucomicrobiota bacterium]